jgi:hypothetical protein
MLTSIVLPKVELEHAIYAGLSKAESFDFPDDETLVIKGPECNLYFDIRNAVSLDKLIEECEAKKVLYSKSISNGISMNTLIALLKSYERNNKLLCFE